jgi:outer membrane protein
MIYKLKKLIFLFIFILNSSTCFANSSVAIIDLDFLIENSNFGKSILDNINQLDKKNISELQKKNNELIKLEKQIQNKQNIISEDAYKIEIDNFKKKVNQFKEDKNLLVKNFNDYKKKEITNFFNQITPIINEYMIKNSIDILIDKKKIFMGKSNIDITENILKKINDSKD